jgi:hypothetical protein
VPECSFPGGHGEEAEVLEGCGGGVEEFGVEGGVEGGGEASFHGC